MYLEKKITFSMEELARIAKVMSKLKVVILDFYKQGFPATFSSLCTWEEILLKIPKLDERELTIYKQATGEKYLASFISQNFVREEKFPAILVSRLTNLFHSCFGEVAIFAIF